MQFGVPQGSIFGSLLFLIYVNDFHNCIAAGDMIMFADDTNIFSVEETMKQYMIVQTSNYVILIIGSLPTTCH